VHYTWHSWQVMCVPAWLTNLNPTHCFSGILHPFLKHQPLGERILKVKVINNDVGRCWEIGGLAKAASGPHTKCGKFFDLLFSLVKKQLS